MLISQSLRLRSIYPALSHVLHLHKWLGRLLLTIGIINGGLGFQFASMFQGTASSNGPKIAYGAMAILVWIIYVSVVTVWAELRRPPRRAGAGVTEELAGLREAAAIPTTTTTITMTRSTLMAGPGVESEGESHQDAGAAKGENEGEGEGEGEGDGDGVGSDGDIEEGAGIVAGRVILDRAQFLSG